ncbi:Dual specificity tyrosine-phosphorylation-regulated kinase [Cladochytrium tenue]|nr:Dual specificity tyrosine-phosphorylation-regulated kinase [Cladochytrium tenue]
MELMGVPPSPFVDRGSRKKLFFDSHGNPRIFPNSKGKKRRPAAKSLGSVLRSPDPAFVDFIARCLVWEPEIRMTPVEALEHEWLRDYLPYGKPQVAEPQILASLSKRPPGLNGRQSSASVVGSSKSSSSSKSLNLSSGRSGTVVSGSRSQAPGYQHATRSRTKPAPSGMTLQSLGPPLKSSETTLVESPSSASILTSTSSSSSYFDLTMSAKARPLSLYVGQSSGGGTAPSSAGSARAYPNPLPPITQGRALGSVTVAGNSSEKSSTDTVRSVAEPPDDSQQSGTGSPMARSRTIAAAFQARHSGARHSMIDLHSTTTGQTAPSLSRKVS